MYYQEEHIIVYIISGKSLRGEVTTKQSQSEIAAPFGLAMTTFRGSKCKLFCALLNNHLERSAVLTFETILTTLFREGHMVDPDGPADVSIKFVSHLPSDSDQSPLQRGRGSKTDDQFLPWIVPCQAFRTFLKGLACPQHLDLQTALRRHRLGLHIGAEDIFRIGLERHELIDVMEINIFLSSEHNLQRTFSLARDRRVEGDLCPGAVLDLPIETSPQDLVLSKIAVGDQVNFRGGGETLLLKSGPPDLERLVEFALGDEKFDVSNRLPPIGLKAEGKPFCPCLSSSLSIPHPVQVGKVLFEGRWIFGNDSFQDKVRVVHRFL